VSITAFGQDYAKDARSALDHFDTLFRSHRMEPELSGKVGITAPHAIGRRFLIPFLQPLAAAHPDLQFDLRLEDQMTDAVEAHIDIGIRVGVIRDRRYVARALAPVPFYVVACPSLIGQKTPPKSLDALAKLPLSVLIDRKNGRPWPWLFADGQTFAPRQPALICDDPDTELEATLAGMCFGQIPAYLAEPHLRSGKLVAVLADHAPAPWDLFIYRPQQGPVSKRVRLVYDHLKQAFSNPKLFPQGLGT